MGPDRQQRIHRIRRSPNFRGGAFRNPVDAPLMAPGKLLEVAREWLRGGKQTRPPGPMPAVALRQESFADPPRGDVRICWLGHSTVLVEMEGARLLFDPVWAERSSPWRHLGPARFQPPPLPLGQLPDLDAVVISHDHYDHLDRNLVRELAAARPRLAFCVPLGVGARLEAWGVPGGCIRELDWWEEAAVADGRIRLVAAPACHFSGRGIGDRNKTLWASWAAIGGGHRVYFGGDGGHHPGFAEIGRRLGPFDLTMLEIGAWHPSWAPIHLGPEKALVAHRELSGRLLLPIHWGTFDLAIHAWDEPIEMLLAGAGALAGSLLLPRLGELACLGAPPPAAPWWRPGPAPGAAPRA
ncbi:MAG TPA: MBL fold metallo-hydrolase [Anaeromyxobacteraceae bacterium]|nr:MBL fold metallo-hydrolase [Anaeromyxobacteraceae bacterium]